MVLTSRLNGGKLKFEDVAPHEIVTDTGSIIDQVVKEFGGVVKIAETKKQD